MKKIITSLLLLAMMTGMMACSTVDEAPDGQGDTSSQTSSASSSETSSEEVKEENTYLYEGVADPSTLIADPAGRGNIGDFAPQAGDLTATFVIEGFGEVKAVLFSEVAPKAVENFVQHASNDYYDGIIFHRVISSFMIQGGDPTGTGMGGTSVWETPFEDEFSPNALNFTGALSMANSGPGTNGSQLFIVNAPNTIGLTEMEVYAEGSAANGGAVYTEADIEKYAAQGGAPWLDGVHTVFGQVYEGLDVVQAIMDAGTDEASRPLESVVITDVVIAEYVAE